MRMKVDTEIDDVSIDLSIDVGENDKEREVSEMNVCVSIYVYDLYI